MASPTPFRFKVTTKEYPCPHCGSHKGLINTARIDEPLAVRTSTVSIVTNAVSALVQLNGNGFPF